MPTGEKWPKVGVGVEREQSTERTAIGIESGTENGSVTGKATSKATVLTVDNNGIETGTEKERERGTETETSL
jgi:hypothetical protein